MTQLHAAGAGAGPAVQWVYNPGALVRGIVALILGALAIYCLHTGQRDRDAGRLGWAVALALGSLLLFL